MNGPSDRRGGHDASALLDRFTSVDEQLTALTEEVQETNRLLRRVANQGQDAGGFGEALPYNLSKDIPPNTTFDNEATTELAVPYDGTMTHVIIGWSRGCNFAAGVRVARGSGQDIIPAGTADAPYVAWDDVTIPFAVDVSVSKGEVIRAEFVNFHQNNEHFIGVLPIWRRE